MAINIDTNAAAEKWQRKAAAAAQDYSNGVERTQNDWQAKTLAGQANYNAGVQAAMSAKRWESNVAKAGTAKWKANTLAKGPGRWVEGISMSGDAYSRGFAPYAQVISGLTLPPRGARGDVKNYARSQAVGQALNAKRTGK